LLDEGVGKDDKHRGEGGNVVGGGGGEELLRQIKKNVFFIKCTNAGHICCILGHSVSRGGRISGNNYALLPVHVAINRETLSVDLYCEFL